MLLRSASTPTLNSWTLTNSSSSSYSSPDQPKSITLSTPPFHSTISINGGSGTTPTRMIRVASDSDLHCHPSFLSAPDSGMSTTGSGSRLLTNSGLGLRERVVVEEEEEEEESSDGGDCGWGGGSDGGGGGGGGGVFGNGNGNGNDNDARDVYYMKMIEANPGNSLLLANYAKFLKEVRGDYVKAEEYCGRAILANPGDPNVLALYADLIWQTQRDSSRAESYFDQAVKAAPDDCYVLGSYAHFLWDAEDEDEDEEDDMKVSSNQMPPMLYHGVSPLPPRIAAAS